jgi:hypothetical protein
MHRQSRERRPLLHHCQQWSLPTTPLIIKMKMVIAKARKLKPIEIRILANIIFFTNNRIFMVILSKNLRYFFTEIL